MAHANKPKINIHHISLTKTNIMWLKWIIGMGNEEKKNKYNIENTLI